MKGVQCRGCQTAINGAGCSCEPVTVPVVCPGCGHKGPHRAFHVIVPDGVCEEETCVCRNEFRNRALKRIEEAKEEGAAWHRRYILEHEAWLGLRRELADLRAKLAKAQQEVCLSNRGSSDV